MAKDMTSNQAQQMRSLLASIRDVLVAAQGVTSRSAEVLDGTEGALLMLDIEREIGAFITSNPALVAARAAANEVRGER